MKVLRSIKWGVKAEWTHVLLNKEADRTLLYSSPSIIKSIKKSSTIHRGFEVENPRRRMVFCTRLCLVSRRRWTSIYSCQWNGPQPLAQRDLSVDWTASSLQTSPTNEQQIFSNMLINNLAKHALLFKLSSLVDA